MDAKTILFPTDFSHTGDAALKLATSLARDMSAKLLIVHVEEPPANYCDGEMYCGIPVPQIQDLPQRLRNITPHDPNITFEHRLVSGSPTAEIVRLAESENVDFIVMSTHGRTGILRFLMGSVAEGVVRRAPCPVLTLKQPASTTAPMT